MPRIRSIHPEQWTDDKFVTCEPLARLLALGLRNEADDNGIFDWNPIKLKMRLLPADNCDVIELLERLESTDQVIRFTDEQTGKTFGMIRNFQKYQKPKKPSFTRPVPSGPLPNGYSLSKAYSGESGSRVDQSRTGSEPVPNRTANQPAEGEGKGRERGKQDPAATPARDEVPLGRVLVEAGWTPAQVYTPKTTVLLRNWQSRGVTTGLLIEAVALARRRCGGGLPNAPTYLRGIVEDLAEHDKGGTYGGDDSRGSGSTHSGLGAKDYTEGAASRLEDLPWAGTRM